MDRLWAQDKASQRTGRKNLFPKDKNGKPSKKPGKGKKLPNKHSGITDRMAVYAMGRAEFPFHFEERCQQIFRLAAIIPSLKDGIIPQDGLTLSGDGTCVHSHASPYGHKACKCTENGITGCPCRRHISDPDAHWGWDSDAEVFYFGHTLYMLCSHNAETGVDLPLHIRFLDARRHDSVSAIVSLREFRTINPDIPVKDICLDRPDSIPDTISIDKDGTPLCMAGFRMVNWGIAARNIPVNGSARSPAAKWTPAPAKKNVLPLLTATVSTPNRTGTYVSIPLSPGVRRNIRKSTITALPARE